MNKYAELFAIESRDNLTAMEHALLDLEADPSARPPLDALFRSVHTLKGMSGVMGYGAVTELAHAIESLLASIRSGDQTLGTDAISTLFEAADSLARAVAVAGAGQGSALDIGPLVARLTASNREQPPLPVAADSPTPPGTPYAVVLERDTPLPGARALIIVDKLRTIGQLRGTVPGSEVLARDDFDGRFVVYLDTNEDDDTVVHLVRSGGYVQDVRVRRAPVTIASAQGPRTVDDAWSTQDLKAPLQRYARIELRRLDHMTNLVGELVTERGRLQTLAAAHNDASLEEIVAKASRLIGELHDAVLGSRMVPVWQVFDRFPRVVRDAARLVGKDAALVLEGREIELDRTLLEQVAEPLVHLLRNAVDHGIETAEHRVSVGKPAVGRVRLVARRERSAVVISVIDDGRGVDRGRILGKARALGWASPEAEDLSDDDVLRFISRPGFSTAEQVSEVSGRGVGIDAVIAKVRALGGTVGFSSREGQGTVFDLRLPVTLAIIPAIIAYAGDEAYALPLTHITETVQPTAGTVARVRGRPVFVLRGHVLPLYCMRELTGGRGRDAEVQQIVILEIADRRAAVRVDRIAGQRDIVVKTFDPVKGAAAYSGAAVLPDGRAALILDLSGLL